MSGTYTILVETEFSAAHSLRGYIGDCARVHGHNWTVQAEVKVTELNDIGLSMDFKQVKGLLKEFVAQLDHYNINDIPPFDKINPTAENIAAWFYNNLKPHINSSTSALTSITLWETNRASIRYEE